MFCCPDVLPSPKLHSHLVILPGLAMLDESEKFTGEPGQKAVAAMAKPAFGLGLSETVLAVSA
jgi:hypothetical protein